MNYLLLCYEYMYMYSFVSCSCFDWCSGAATSVGLSIGRAKQIPGLTSSFQVDYCPLAIKFVLDENFTHVAVLAAALVP